MSKNITNKIVSEEYELTILALNTKCIKELERLSKSPYQNVRKAVVKNICVSADLVNILAEDPVKNVSMLALNHRLYCGTRDKESWFNETSPCLSCEHDLCLGLNCEKDKSYNAN